MDAKKYYGREYYGVKVACPKSLCPELLLKYLEPEVLDLGCGQGLMAKEIGRHMAVFGCDIFPGVSKLGKNFFFHDMEEKPTQKKFASIYCLHVLEHVFDYVSFLRNAGKSLKEGGIFFIAVPNSYSLLSRAKFFFGKEQATFGSGNAGCVERNELEPHVRFFGKKSLKAILEKNGFEVKEFFGTTGGKKSALGGLAGQLNFACRKKPGCKFLENAGNLLG